MEIEKKMRDIQSMLRQERDLARRDYELAMERYGLLRVEVQSIEATVREREKELAMIQAETKPFQEKASLRQAVDRLVHEVCA